MAGREEGLVTRVLYAIARPFAVHVRPLLLWDLERRYRRDSAEWRRDMQRRLRDQG